MDNHFDNNIKKQLEDYKVDYNHQDWDAMQAKLDATFGTDDTFDEIISDKIGYTSEVYDSSTWPLLEKKITNRNALRQNILVAKLSEVVIILLLLFSVSHYATITKSSFKQKTALTSPSVENFHTKPSNIRKTKDVKLDKEARQEVRSPNAEKSVSLPIPEQNSKTKDVQPKKTIQGFATVNSLYKDIPTTSSRHIESISALPRKELLSHADYADNTFLPPISIDEISFSSIMNNPQSNDLVRVDVLPRAEIGILDAGMRQQLDAMAIIPIQKKNKSRYLSMSYAYDINLIDRPLDFQLLQEPFSYGATGFSGGVQYGSKSNRTEFETGLLYSVKSSDPNMIEKISVDNSYYERNFELQKFEVIKIPMDYKYHFIDNSSWSMYASASLDINLVAIATYEYEDNLKSGASKSSLKINSKSTLSKRQELNEGFFENMKIARNTFFAAGGGIGLIKNVGSYGLFFESNYKHHILSKHLGPNNEKFSTLSFETGIRKRI